METTSSSTLPDWRVTTHNQYRNQKSSDSCRHYTHIRLCPLSDNHDQNSFCIYSQNHKLVKARSGRVNKQKSTHFWEAFTLRPHLSILPDDRSGSQGVPSWYVTHQVVINIRLPWHGCLFTSTLYTHSLNLSASRIASNNAKVVLRWRNRAARRSQQTRGFRNKTDKGQMRVRLNLFLVARAQWPTLTSEPAPEIQLLKMTNLILKPVIWFWWTRTWILE